ncbi:ATP-binding cassette domain-containing protein [Halorubraceae archaeon YAN]|nr:ATP-binding cassette domain-containing protein [Halorubraceae archaeon YAN]
MSKQQLGSEREFTDSLLTVTDLKKYYPVKGGILRRRVGDVKAVDGVSMEIHTGETYGLVGESGCGKSTFGKTITRLVESTDGSIIFDGKDITQLSKSEMNALRKDIQIIFQDPASCLNPRMNVRQLIEEPMSSLTDWSQEEKNKRVHKLIKDVNLSVEHLSRPPHEFSGGQQQRIAIARALSVEPKLIVADEPTSALDVSVQAKILNLLKNLQAEYNLTYLFISHDLSVIKHICDRVAVMYLGQIAEESPTQKLFEAPKHPYTKALLSSVPKIGGFQDDRIKLQGTVPSPENPPSGCRYHTRCQEYIGEICEEEVPKLKTIGEDNLCACHHY